MIIEVGHHSYSFNHYPQHISSWMDKHEEPHPDLRQDANIIIGSGIHLFYSAPTLTFLNKFLHSCRYMICQVTINSTFKCIRVRSRRHAHNECIQQSSIRPKTSFKFWWVSIDTLWKSYTTIQSVQTRAEIHRASFYPN